jgi:hypothetical protein
LTCAETISSHKFKVFLFSFFLLALPSFSWAQVLPGRTEASDDEEGLEFHPSFSVSERYQDNVRQEAFDNRQEDFSVRWRPGLDLKYNGYRHSHELEYFSEFTRYHQLHEEDTNTHLVVLNNNLALREIVEFNVRTTESFRSERQDLRQAERRNNFLETNVFTVNPTLRINVVETTSLIGFYTYSRTSIMEEDQEDYLSNTFGGSLNQQLYDVVELFCGYRQVEQDFLKDTPDFVDNVYFGGLNWDIMSTLRLEGEYGYSVRRYDKETDFVTDLRTENDIWSVVLRNDITETTHVDISYSQSQQVREITDTEQILRETLSAGFQQILVDLLRINLNGSYSEEDYQFTDRRDINSNVNLLLVTIFSEIISFQAGGGYGNNYFWPDAVRENVYSYQAGITYSPLEWLTGSVNYRHVETDNDSPEGSTDFRAEFDQNSVTVTLAARF